MKALKYHTIDYQIVPIEKYACKGRPKSDSEKHVVGFNIQSHLSSSLKKIKHEKEKLGRFILAINQMGANKLTRHGILTQ